MEKIDLLAEIEDVLRTAPPKATIRHDTPENQSWFGRAVAAVELWDSAAGMRATTYVNNIYARMAHETNQNYQGLMVLLNQARSSLRMQTLGSVSLAIGQGFVFDYFDGLRKLITLAQNDIFFNDPYLDADFVATYLPHVADGVTIRLLTRKGLATLVPAAKLFAQQNKQPLELRATSQLHDRYVLIDRSSCYQSGASFKDGGRNAGTTITQITDAFAAVQKTYEDLWLRAKPEL